MDKIVRIGIVSRNALKQFQGGTSKTLVLFEESDLHHIFGDSPEEFVERVQITIEEVEHLAAKA